MVRAGWCGSTPPSAAIRRSPRAVATPPGRQAREGARRLGPGDGSWREPGRDGWGGQGLAAARNTPLNTSGPVGPRPQEASEARGCT